MIYEIIASLEATSKRTEKEAILTALEGSNEQLFKKVCTLAYDPRIDYYIKAYGRSTEHSGLIGLEQALDSLYQLSSRTLTGNAARDFLLDLDSKLSFEDSEVLWKVIQRDFRCGISASTINKAWPDLIYIHPYMRCSSFNAKNLKAVSFPCFSQTKEDGLYVDIVVSDQGLVEYRSRSGSYLTDFSNNANNQLFSAFKSVVFMGEALVLNEDGSFMDRSAGNGYLNSNDIDSERICFVLWDVVPLGDYKKQDSKTEYQHRFNKLQVAVSAMGSNKILIVGSRVVKSIDDILEHFKGNVLEGKEGTVVKNFATKWKHGTSKDQVKVKIEFTCELKVIAVVEGTGKNEGRLGALLSESADGLLRVSVGGGYSDQQRIDYFTEDMVGSIIEVKSNDVIHSKVDNALHSLFLPRHTKIRTDKTEADTLERIIEQRDAFVHILEAIC